MYGSRNLGLFLTFVGFLVVGSVSVYLGNSNPASPQDLAQLTKSAATTEGIGWILAGLGLVLALHSTAADIEEVRTVVPDVGPDVAAVEAHGHPLTARKVPKKQADYVCSDCGGDTSADATVCPHCGAPIEGE